MRRCIQGSSFGTLRNCLYFKAFNSPDNCNSTSCPFVSLYLLAILAPFSWCQLCTAAAEFCPVKVIYFFLSWIFSSVYLSWYSVSFLNCYQTFLSMPLCNAQQAGGARGLLLWKPCLGKCHCFRQRRTGLNRTSRNSLDCRHFDVLSGSLKASAYCVLWNTSWVGTGFLTHCLSISLGWRWRVASGGRAI